MSLTIPEGYSVRAATPVDAPIIAVQRGQMFVEMGGMTPQEAGAQRGLWTDWLAQALAAGDYAGFVIENAGEIVGGVGMMFLPKIPTTKDPALHKAHILNMSVSPQHRRRGLAGALMRSALQEARQRGLRSVSLNAAPMGKGLYERLGFVESTSPEMRLTLEGGA